ncbi:MAG: rhodanese-like domain-containing protein [Bacteroidales bacterium]|nr:rhodanese-like domain-containing protein [Bacteroidales bacterium]
MKIKSFILYLILFFLAANAMSQNISLEDYLLNYDYESRKDMKIKSEELIELLNSGKAQLIDIRFEEEYQSWNMPFAISIPLPDLPKNLHMIDKSKIIVTACPHSDRAIIAMTYLKTLGYEVKYLSDGLLGLAAFLRGDNAREFINK